MHVCVCVCMHVTVNVPTTDTCMRTIFIPRSKSLHTLTQVTNDVVQHRSIDLHVVDIGNADAIANLVTPHSAMDWRFPGHFHRCGQRPHPHLSQLWRSQLRVCSKKRSVCVLDFMFFLLGVPALTRPEEGISCSCWYIACLHSSTPKKAFPGLSGGCTLIHPNECISWSSWWVYTHLP